MRTLVIKSKENQSNHLDVILDPSQIQGDELLSTEIGSNFIYFVVKEFIKDENDNQTMKIKIVKLLDKSLGGE